MPCRRRPSPTPDAADLAPWIAGDGAKDRITGLVMIGPDDPGSLEFRVSEMLGIRANDPIFQVADAIRSTAGIPMLFVHGEKDDSSSASSLVNVAAEPKTLMVIPGGDHQFSGTGDRFRNNLLQGLD